MTNISCKVWYRGKMVAQYAKFTRTGLWMMPLTETRTEQPQATTPSQNQDTGYLPSQNQDTVHLAQSAYSTSTSAELAQYHHQSLFSPPTSTILKAIKNNQLTSFPGLTVRLYNSLPPSTATHKGHMKQHRQNVRSTQSNTETIRDARLNLEDMNPTQEACATQNVDMLPIYQANSLLFQLEI